MLPRLAAIEIPPVVERAHEIERLFEAYGRDAMSELGAPALGFRRSDLAWVRGGNIATLDEVANSARHMVALRNWKVTAAAERLGINHGALISSAGSSLLCRFEREHSPGRVLGSRLKRLKFWRKM